MASSSYCYSDITYGVTNNVAGNGLSWSMGDYLPDSSSPYVTVEINGLFYQYTMGKNPEDDAKVYVRNKDPNGGYVFEEVDDWSGLPGGNIQKYFRFPYTDSSRWGDGEIAVEGNGEVSNARVVYNYRMEADEFKLNCAANPLIDPQCPGYAQALAAYLASLTNPPIDDPFYDEWVQLQLEKNNETPDTEEEMAEVKEEEEEESLEERLGAENNIDSLVDGAQQAQTLAALANVGLVESYYDVTIAGGVYQETVVLVDNTISDNRKALRNLASDANHRKMVRSQYEEQ